MFCCVVLKAAALASVLFEGTRIEAIWRETTRTLIDRPWRTDEEGGTGNRTDRLREGQGPKWLWTIVHHCPDILEVEGGRDRCRERFDC